MRKSRIPSPARSQGAATTPRRKKSRGSRSVCSPALSTASGRLTSLIDQFKDKNMTSFALSPLNSRSVLNDNTDIEEPRRKSWWKKLDENSQYIMEVLEDNKLTDANNGIEELIDIEILSQEKKNFTLDLPESSDNESINSIVLPQRKLFTQKENQPQKKFGQLVENRETLAKLHKPNTTNIEPINVGTRELFQNTKRCKPIFPAALLNISPNKTMADKTKENIIVEPKPQVRNIFGNRPTKKRKNMFADFIVSESEDEISDIQPKVFGFQKKPEQRRISSISRGRDPSPTSSITTDIEMDDWKLLPSSTMVEIQLEDMVACQTPIKRARLSKLSEAKESEAGTMQTNTTADKSKQSNKSASSKNKSKSSPEIKDRTLDNSRTTRSMLQNNTKLQENDNTSIKQDMKKNKSQSEISAKDVELDVSSSMPEDTENRNTTLNKSQKQNKSRTRISSKIIEEEIVSVENNVVLNAINNETRVINKSTKKLSNSTVTYKSRNEDNMEIYTKESKEKINRSGCDNVKQNYQEDDEHNFTLEYENDDNENVDQLAAHKSQKDIIKNQNTVVLGKYSQEEEINISKNNKSLQKPAKVIEEFVCLSVESQKNEQLSADDNVDDNLEKEPETGDNEQSEVEKNVSQGALHKVQENESEHIEDEVNISRKDKTSENEGNQEVNVSQEHEGEVNISQENEDETNKSEDNEEEEKEDDDDEVDANESENDNEAVNVSQEGEDIDTREEEIANQSQEAENDENEEESNAEDDNNDEANVSQEVEAEISQEIKEQTNESQEIDEESQEVEDNDASDEEEAANESQENDVSVNNNQEIENEEESEAVESEADAYDSEKDEEDQMEDSAEADKAIASDANMSEQDDDNLADEMEVDDDDENQQESDEEANQSEQEHDESHEERQTEDQNEAEPSAEEIEESPNVTHDTTGRNRKKNLANKSPEVMIQHDITNQMDSFTAKGRNTSIRKTKSIIKSFNIKPRLATPGDSTGFSDGTKNSSAEGSGWDSHRTTRKTLRQTFGKDFTPRKSLRALVMEKSAKRQTEHLDMNSETIKFPQANSTEFPEDTNRDFEDVVESDHEVSRRTRQSTLEEYLKKINQKNIEMKLKMEEAVRNSFKGPVRDTFSLFKVPNKPAPRSKPIQSKPKKQIKSIIPFVCLPSEVIEDMKYKPPKRFQPPNASWATKRLYKFLETKLEAKYDYKARVRAEKLIETIYHFTKNLRRHDVAPTDAVEVLKHELARLDIVHTHFEFYDFFHEFMPREVRVKVVPDIVNKIPLPRHGVFSDILLGHAVQE